MNNKHKRKPTLMKLANVLLQRTDDGPNWNRHCAAESWNWPGSTSGFKNRRALLGLLSKQRPRPELTSNTTTSSVSDNAAINENSK